MMGQIKGSILIVMVLILIGLILLASGGQDVNIITENITNNILVNETIWDNSSVAVFITPTFPQNLILGDGFANGGITLEGDGDIWMDGSLFITGNISNVNVSNLNVNGSLIPTLDDAFVVGNSTHRWKGGHFSDNLTIDGTLIGGIPQVAFESYLNNTQTVIQNVVTMIQFDTEVFDLNNNFDTNNYNFTAPMDGIYIFSCGYTLGATSSGANAVVIYLSIDDEIVKSSRTRTATATDRGLSMNTELRLSDGEKVACLVEHANSGTQDLQAGRILTWFTGSIIYRL